MDAMLIVHMQVGLITQQAQADLHGVVAPSARLAAKGRGPRNPAR
jgi:hypothetical protein